MMSNVSNSNPIQKPLQLRTPEQVRQDPKAIDPKELEGKSQAEQDRLVAARAETLAAQGPEGNFDFSNNSLPSSQSLDAAGSNLSRNSTGPEVAALQQQLNLNGANPPLKLDGRFGGKTAEAVKAYQQANGLKADGVAGPNTINTMKANDAISRMNQFGGKADAESQAKYAQAKAEAEKSVAALPEENRAGLQGKLAEASKKNDATAGPAPIDTSKPLTDQGNQAAANANAANNAAAKNTAIQQGNEALDKAKNEVAKMPGGEEKVKTEAKVKEAEGNLSKAAGNAARETSSQAEAAAKDARAAADEAAQKQKSADEAAKGPQTEQSATHAGELQKAANDAKAEADQKAKAAEKGITEAQALADNPITPEADKDYANRNLTNARQDLSAAKTQNNLTAPAGGEVSAQAKAAMEQAKAEARSLNDQNNAHWFNDDANQNQVGAKLADGLLAQAGALPDGTVKGLVEGLGKVRNPDEVAAGLVNKLGPEGLAKLSEGDKQHLRQMIGNFMGAMSDAPQVQAARLLGVRVSTLDRPFG